MTPDTKKEIKGRTVELEAYEQEKHRLEILESRLNKLYRMTHIMVKGKRVRLTKRKSIAMANAMIDRSFDKALKIKKDAANQLRIMDA